MTALLPQRRSRGLAVPLSFVSGASPSERSSLFNTDGSHKFVRIIRDLSFSDDSKDKNS